ncbi:MAG: hypothetical protein LBP24_00560 [Coriobacteriales bacterium]|jgi:hypothetical protein|nr:hypothetical protein [Coriobacteriales bacterium]
MITSDVKVSDTEYRNLARLYRSYGILADRQLNKYCQCLEGFCESGITSGKLYNNLQLFLDNAKLLRDRVSHITEAMATRCETYCSEIDTLDQYLY